MHAACYEESSVRLARLRWFYQWLRNTTPKSRGRMRSFTSLTAVEIVENCEYSDGAQVHRGTHL